MKKLLSFLLVIAIIFSIGGVTAFAENNSVKYSDLIIHENYFPQDYIGYRYPILPGTSQWRKFENHQQMVDACQIPDNIYQNMTTEELAQTILAYPLNADMYAYDNFETGFSIVKKHFEGLQEFCARTDSTENLIDLYSRQELVEKSELDQSTLQAFKSDDAIVTTEAGKKASKQIFNTLTLSLFLTQDDFLDKITPAQELEISEIIPLRAGTPSYFVGFDSTYNGKIATSQTTVQTPKGGSMTAYNMEAVEIWRYSDGYNYLRQLSDLSSDAKTSLNTQYYDIYGINPISGSGPTVKYNCHSYAWYRQSNCNYWINTFSTSGYTSVNKLDVNVGGKMVYYNSNDDSYSDITHSAVITGITYYPRSQVTFVVKSKWGMCGLYEHSWENSPYFYINKFPCDLKYYNS